MKKKLIIILGVVCGVVVLLFLLAMQGEERQVFNQGTKEVTTGESGLNSRNEEEINGFNELDYDRGQVRATSDSTALAQIQETSLTLVGKDQLVQLGMTQAAARNVETEVIKNVIELDLGYVAIATVNRQSVQVDATNNGVTFQVIISDSRELMIAEESAAEKTELAEPMFYETRVQFVPESSAIESFSWERTK
ncbi:hypothetical protein FWH30_02595 [Microgenomates group bacterium]|nr:hypothetical protein [Microgenomates group bacterium]